MTDASLLVVWLAVLGAGIGAVVILHERGLPSTYGRDLLHVGAGAWVLGWPAWSSPVLPIALVVLAAAATVAVPIASRRLALAASFERSVSGGDESWRGLVLYTLAFAVFTVAGLGVEPFPAAAALLALSLGDGIGGLVGRKLGRVHYRAPGAKKKSIEGSIVVAVMAALGAAFASAWLGAPVGVEVALGIGIVAAVAEALSPRGTDNIVVPGAVWLFASLVT